MKQLSMKQATRCEAAKTPRCKCRCGGKLHGTNRGLDSVFFASLPESDPHRAMERAERPPRQRKQRALPLFDQEV